MVGWVKFTLTTEQKKTDYKPESDDMAMYSPVSNSNCHHTSRITTTYRNIYIIYNNILYSIEQACMKVVKYIKSQKEVLEEGLDGKNVEALFTEFGIRFHRVVFEHLQQYQYNSMGEDHTVTVSN